MYIEVGAHTFQHLVLIGNKLKLLFFRIRQWFCLMFSCRQTHFDDPLRCKDASPTYICLTVNLCFCLSYHRPKFWNGLFPHLEYLAKIPENSVIDRQY